MAPVISWDELMDSDTDDEIEEDVISISGPGTGHHYQTPFMIDDIAIVTSGDFTVNYDLIYNHFIEMGYGEQSDAIWAPIARDMIDISNPDEMDAAAYEFLMLVDLTPISPDILEALNLISADIAETAELIDTKTRDDLEAYKKELTLDVFDDIANDTKFTIPEIKRSSKPIQNSINKSPVPPMCPIVPETKPKWLIFSSGYQELDLQVRYEWKDGLKKIDKLFPSDKIDTYMDNPSLVTSRSNSRPGARNSVLIMYDDDIAVNIGSHGYNIKEDIKLNLDFDDIVPAISEVLSAPGGEGLTCPTPSHLLHQLVSSILSYSLKEYSPIVEPGVSDIMFPPNGTSILHKLHIDITTSAGIWNKRLEEDSKVRGTITQAAVSKYDLSAIFLNVLPVNAKNLLYKAIANCLHCEYPSTYRIDEEDVPSDLKIQSSIYDTLASLPQRKIQSLGKLAYEAVIQEGMTNMQSVDIHQQGMSWRTKRDILVKSIDDLKPRQNIAMPPVPIGEIMPLPSGPLSIDINGHHFQSGPYIIQNNSQGPKYQMADCSSFLRDYPVVGIVNYTDAKEIADLIDTSPIEVTGLSHKGPCQDYQGPDSHFVSAANEIYMKSGQAQLAEIRADLTRAIYNLPMPKENHWAQCYLYKGKICCWYRCRDPPNSPDGYRIDWFAVSSFPVVGSVEILTMESKKVHLWPRQRIRSQEMQLAHDGPRRLKVTLFSMLEKMNASGSSLEEIYLAWTRLNLTLNSSTYGSGKEHIPCRFLSSTISSPSSPFHKMSKKLVNPVTFADVSLLRRLRKVLLSWSRRNEYRDRSAILGLPRAYSQLESYWVLWVPSEFASRHSSMVDCVIALKKESDFLHDTMPLRQADLIAQQNILYANEITVASLRASIRATCDLDMGGQMGWSWIGSLASGYALNLASSAAQFDRRYSRGHRARNITNHLTVRHSARIDSKGALQKGTVAEMILDQGIDDFLSIVEPVYRFLYIKRPIFFNHPKKGEHKPREISITDPDSRICLSDAELLTGTYGKTTGVDFLKDPAKNAKFYRTSSRVITKGGGIQSSDATRYGPSMSNFAIAIMLLFLGSYSMHLKWSSIVYARLAYRKMLIPTDIIPVLEKLSAHEDVKEESLKTIRWIDNMPIEAYEDGSPLKSYCTSHHMGQGMSHHSSSLLHAGGIIASTDAAKQAIIKIRGVTCEFKVHIMVTSDDSTVIVEPHAKDDGDYLTRSDKQTAARIYLQLLRSTRDVGLRIVSVCPNLVKEIISAVKGEFNSQDTGVGVACPILGFREMISLIVVPSAPSLVGDYINAFSIARDIALAGQGVSTGCFIHKVQIDSIEERWKLTRHQQGILNGKNILPKELVNGSSGISLLSSPASLLHPDIRASMLRESIEVNALSEDLDPHTRDSVFSSLMHIKVSMSKQHKKAITCLKKRITDLKSKNLFVQAELLDTSLRATLSSARTRNLGRVAFRVRNRKVKPRKYRDIVFETNTMLETTLNWIIKMEDTINSMAPSASDIAIGNSVAGHVKIVSKQSAGFPRPPRLRRFVPIQAKKPKYVTNSYGITPFGVHAVARSGVSRVFKIGEAERQLMLKYLAQVRHRKFSEHVEYGGTFVTSWSELRGGKIVALGNTNEWSQEKREHIKKGDFSEKGLILLRTLSEEHKDIPILAMHSYDGSCGVWHCIHKGIAYNVIKRLDLETHEGQAISHQIETGQYVLLALQGFATDGSWEDTVPTKTEIHSYQHSNYSDPMPDIVRSVEDENILEGAATSVTYSTEIEYNSQKTLIYVAPEIRQTPWQNTRLLKKVPQLRGKVVASLSAAGYWHTSLRGVAFRAYLRKSFNKQTIWTGGVIGWRASSTTVPMYYNDTSQATGVKAILIMGGYNDIDQISPYNPDTRTSGYKSICESRTETYDRAIQVPASFVPHIVHANNGQRYHYNCMGSTFLSMEHAEIATPDLMPTAASAVQSIISLLDGEDDDDVW